MSSKLKKLTSYLTKFNGIGPRQASRMALDMLDWPQTDIEEFAQTVAEIKLGPLICEECFNFSDNKHCAICLSHKRDKTKIAVVEKISDLEAMEKSGTYGGVYHVLGGAISPAEGKLPEKLKIKELKERVKKLLKRTPDVEVILATNPNTQGETTALYLTEELKPLSVKTTRLARGLAAGSSLEYVDEVTLANALKDRK